MQDLGLSDKHTEQVSPAVACSFSLAQFEAVAHPDATLEPLPPKGPTLHEVLSEQAGRRPAEPRSRIRGH